MKNDKQNHPLLAFIVLLIRLLLCAILNLYVNLNFKPQSLQALLPLPQTIMGVLYCYYLCF